MELPITIPLHGWTPWTGRVGCITFSPRTRLPYLGDSASPVQRASWFRDNAHRTGLGIAWPTGAAYGTIRPAIAEALERAGIPGMTRVVVIDSTRNHSTLNFWPRPSRDDEDETDAALRLTGIDPEVGRQALAGITTLARRGRVRLAAHNDGADRPVTEESVLAALRTSL